MLFSLFRYSKTPSRARGLRLGVLHDSAFCRTPAPNPPACSPHTEARWSARSARRNLQACPSRSSARSTSPCAAGGATPPWLSGFARSCRTGRNHTFGTCNPPTDPALFSFRRMSSHSFRLYFILCFRLCVRRCSLIPFFSLLFCSVFFCCCFCSVLFCSARWVPIHMWQ